MWLGMDTEVNRSNFLPYMLCIHVPPCFIIHIRHHNVSLYKYYKNDKELMMKC